MKQERTRVVKPLRGRPAVPAPALSPLDVTSDEPIERQVYSVIRHSIMSGDIMPGARLSSRSIAEALGVSPMPVREALKRLDADGVLTSVAKSAFTISSLTKVEYQEILNIRLMLEPMLGQKATKRLNDRDINRAGWLQDRMMTTTNWRQYLNYNYQLHFLVYRAADLPHTLSLIENVWLKLGPTLHMLHGEQITLTASEHHSALLKGLKKRDPVLVEEALRADIKNAGRFANERLT